MRVFPYLHFMESVFEPTSELLYSEDYSFGHHFFKRWIGRSWHKKWSGSRDLILMLISKLFLSYFSKTSDLSSSNQGFSVVVGFCLFVPYLSIGQILVGNSPVLGFRSNCCLGHISSWLENLISLCHYVLINVFRMRAQSVWLLCFRNLRSARYSSGTNLIPFSEQVHYFFTRSGDKFFKVSV